MLLAGSPWNLPRLPGPSCPPTQEHFRCKTKMGVSCHPPNAMGFMGAHFTDE